MILSSTLATKRLISFHYTCWQVGVPIMCYDNGLQPRVLEAPMWPLNNPVVCFFFRCNFFAWSPSAKRDSMSSPKQRAAVEPDCTYPHLKTEPSQQRHGFDIDSSCKGLNFQSCSFSIHVYPKSPGAPLKVKASSLRPNKRREKKYWYWCSQRLELWQALHARSPVAKKRHR